jgi:hypothetical protein
MASVLLVVAFGHRDLCTLHRQTSFCGDFSKKELIRMTREARRDINTLFNKLLPTLTQGDLVKSHETLQILEDFIREVGRFQLLL